MSKKDKKKKSAESGAESVKKKKREKTSGKKGGRKADKLSVKTVETGFAPYPEEPRKSRKTLRKQRNRRILISLILVLSIITAAVFLSLKLLFIVREVQVSGSERYTREEIQAFCAVPPEENIFSVDTEGLKTALEENFTYIETVRVKRRLPDKIRIEITDAVPTYYTVQPEGETFVYTVYSAGFKQLTRQASAPEGLVAVEVDLGDEEARDTLLEIIGVLEDGGYTGYTKVAVSASKEVSVTYADRITVELGSVSRADYKIKLAWHVIEEELEEDRRGIIDASEAGNAVYRPRV